MQPGLEHKEFSYQPGDALGFVCANDSREVDYLLERFEHVHTTHEVIFCSH